MLSSFDVDYPATLEHLADARHQLRDWMATEVPDVLARTDLLAVAGEFFLHVIVRTGGLGRARIVAEHRPGGVRLAVTSAVEAPAIRTIDLPPDPLSEGSLGRRLVEGCCDDVKVERGEGVGAECWRAVRSA